MAAREGNTGAHTRSDVAVRAVLVLALVGAGILFATDALDPGRVWALLALLLAVVAAACVQTRHIVALSRRVKSVSVAGLSIEVIADAGAVVAAAPDEDAPGHAESAQELRLRLQKKITYLAKHVLDPNGPTFVTVGSLLHDGLLTRAEAGLADAILTARFADRAQEPALFERAEAFVDGFRATVFHALVRTLLARHDPTSTPVTIGGRRRPDLRTAAFSGEPQWLAPVFTFAVGAGERAERELASLRKRSDGGGAVVVVPRRTGPATDPNIWSLADVRNRLTPSEPEPDH